MRSVSVFLILFCILLVGSLSDARLGPEEYWRSVMKDDPMPKAISDSLSQQSSKKERFIRNFVAQPSPKHISSHSHFSHKYK
ncbi:Organ specific protein [Artemisia annua]|uniref:Organ specific protein n=1 Tax=Artemisia annua TaxID=35608 RepID=A0A2U1LSD0_ARTAN|nr:Organ specific protein [Artemisia annua]